MQFDILGPLRVTAQQQVSISAVRLRVLLAVLLWRANQPVPVDEIYEALWDGKLPRDPSGALRTLVRRLRHVLGPQAGARIGTHAPGYLIEVGDTELDVTRFEALCRGTVAAAHDGRWAEVSATAGEALALWRGQPLADVPCQMLRDLWLPQLEQTRLQAIEWRIEADLQQGRHERVVPQLRYLAELHPLREHFRAQLMLALVRTGRQAEALEVYREARHVLVGELGIEPGPELRRVHEAILAGDADLLPSPPRDAEEQGPAHEHERDAATAPRQLPAAVRHFTGRHSELDFLSSLLEPVEGTAGGGGTVVISAIDGMAGIGKTALAVYVAHRLADKFPDGQLFLDLHGYTQGQQPRTSDQALDWLLRALDVPPERIPRDGEQAAALYRQRLADTRTLIVLDNAATEAQVRPLLPGTGSCLVLVTSRRRLKALDDAHTLSLDLLPARDAVALLYAVAGPGRFPADDPQLGEVAELCGYLPLGLRIAASLLRHRPTWSLEHLAGQLRDQHQRVATLSDGDRELAAVFDLSYTSLDELHRRLWRRLGLVPGPDLDGYAAAALVELDRASAAELLEDLVDHNLLTAHAPGRYRLHDLLRARARTLVTAAEPSAAREAAVDRLLRYYARAAESASIPIARYPRPRPDATVPAVQDHDPESARTWLRTEYPNLDAAFTAARARGLDEHVIALAAGLAEFLGTDGPLTRAMQLHQTAAETAERLGHRVAHANALTELGRARRLTGDYPGADDVATQALEIYRALDYRLGEANALHDLGRVRYLTGDSSRSDDAHTRALEIYQALNDRHGEANALTELGRVRHLTGDYPGAADAQTRALEIYRALGDRYGEATALTTVGRVRRLTGDYLAAADAHTRALEIYRALGHRIGEANALTDLGRIRHLTGDYVEAEDAHIRGLEIYRALGHGLGEANTLVNLGRVRHLTGDYPGAADAHTSALEIYRTLGDRSGEAWALNYYAATHAAIGRRARALALFQQARVMNRELNKPDDEAVALEGIAEHHLATGDPVQGIAYLRQALEMYERLGMAPDARRVQSQLDDLTA